MWSDTMHNKKVITSGYESSLDKFMVKSHSFDLQVPDGVKVTTKEMRKADQKKSLGVVKGGNSSKKPKKRWTAEEHRQRGPWSEEEDQILIEAHKTVGNKWSEISFDLPGRSENTIKNHWNSTLHLKLSKNPLNDSKLKSYISFRSSYEPPPLLSPCAANNPGDLGPNRIRIRSRLTSSFFVTTAWSLIELELIFTSTKIARMFINWAMTKMLGSSWSSFWA
ncbi:unnamed protein product [Microthlaspi erraticum]|uniref:Uncharacterized protein n=1 Tax=Microthlaspi erraticum TaxID=1685480 RepID=A0A6D2HI30_9BRAS|nr:unnamed protein product [Microthlaspi erraticum]